MPNTIKIKNSAVAAKVPLTTDLDYGELALNYADGKIFYKRSDNTVQSISGGGGAGDVTLAGTQTLTNKTIDYASNTLTGVQPTLVSGTTIKTINSTSLLGSGDIVISGGGASALTIDNKTGAYTVVAGDLGKIINCTSGTFTVSLTAAATLGAGFNCTIWNTSTTASDAITIDPSGTETIDGLTTLILRRGEGLQLVCDGTNFQTGDKKTVRGYAENISASRTPPAASGVGSIAIGSASSASNNDTLALGYGTTASGLRSLAIGINTSATGDNSTAIGRNSGSTSSQAVTGSGAMALGGSYASGTDSFAAAVANNTSSYGATGPNSVALGLTTRATGGESVSLGSNCLASSTWSFAFGAYSEATRAGAVAVGVYALSSISGKYVYSGGRFASTGDAQTGTFAFRQETTNATATVLTTNNAAASTTNQIILPNNSAYAFTGTVIARQQASTGSNYAAWEIKGALLRDATAASTVLGSFNINTLSKTAGATAWAVTLTADTTNGGLAVTVTGAAATNIRWVANVQTSEVTYA